MNCKLRSAWKATTCVKSDDGAPPCVMWQAVLGAQPICPANMTLPSERKKALPPNLRSLGTPTVSHVRWPCTMLFAAKAGGSAAGGRQARPPTLCPRIIPCLQITPCPLNYGLPSDHSPVFRKTPCPLDYALPFSHLCLRTIPYMWVTRCLWVPSRLRCIALDQAHCQWRATSWFARTRPSALRELPTDLPPCGTARSWGPLREGFWGPEFRRSPGSSN